MEEAPKTYLLSVVDQIVDIHNTTKVDVIQFEVTERSLEKDAEIKKIEQNARKIIEENENELKKAKVNKIMIYNKTRMTKSISSEAFEKKTESYRMKYNT